MPLARLRIKRASRRITDDCFISLEKAEYDALTDCASTDYAKSAKHKTLTSPKPNLANFLSQF